MRRLTTDALIFLVALATTACGARTALLESPPAAAPADALDATSLDALDATSLDALDALDALEAPDAPDSPDAADTFDAPDAADTFDAPDSPDALDVAPERACDPASCDDRNACTVDRCEPDGTCSRAPVVCDDGDRCTADRCDPARGCVSDPLPCGCADGTREAFRDMTRYPNIAGCSGAWTAPGLRRDTPTCMRRSGNDGANPTGMGCAAADLCRAGWHVCRGVADVARSSADGCRGAADAPPESFFAALQSGPGCHVCATGTDPSCTSGSCRVGCAFTAAMTNDLFGCGNVGATPNAATCGVLDRASNDQCTNLPRIWSCPGDTVEYDTVTKAGAGNGGVLCCRD